MRTRQHTKTCGLGSVGWKMHGETDVGGVLRAETCCPTTLGLSVTANISQVILPNSFFDKSEKIYCTG